MAGIPRFYVYVLARPNGKPFYVGKGQGKRVFKHDEEAKSGHQCYKCNVIRKIWREGKEYQRYIIFTTNNEQEAFDYEKETIALYGRRNLCNLTDGGEGASNPSQETLKKRSASLRKTFATPESKTKRSEISKRVPRTSEWRTNQSKAMKGRKLSSERREAMSQYFKAKPSKMSPEAIEQLRERMKGNTYGVGKGKKGKVISQEARRKTSETLKAKAPWKGKKHTTESIAKMHEVQSARSDIKAKDYQAISPDGVIYAVHNLVRFCAEYKFIYDGVQRAMRTGKTYKGWRFSRIV